MVLVYDRSPRTVKKNAPMHILEFPDTSQPVYFPRILRLITILWTSLVPS